LDGRDASRTPDPPDFPSLLLLPIADLSPDPGNPRLHSRQQVRAIARSIDEFGFNAPVLIDEGKRIIAGHGRYEAAKLLGRPKIPTLCLAHLSKAQAHAYMLADNKLNDRSNWDDPKLAAFLKELSLEIPDLQVTGFEQPEIDLRIQSADESDPDSADDFETSDLPPISTLGDLWNLGKHKIFCGNALDSGSYDHLQGEQASAVFTDPPYNVKIGGHVRGKGKRHKEFVMGSGELTAPQFQLLLNDSLKNCAEHSQPGALIYVCMDWRHMSEMLTAGAKNYLQLTNLCVWVKTSGAMGSMYRSRHELVFVFKNGKSAHVNNIQLGRFGRNRTNVWNYAGANGFGRRDSIDDFDSHPTVKPVRLVQDAILDCTHQGNIILDPYLGSGTTILAAERTGRRCFGIELDPVHVDTAIRRWEAMTAQKAVNDKGLSFEDTAAAKLPAQG
jgi:DNA modification methylase